jgi:2'-5' RNA ligase
MRLFVAAEPSPEAVSALRRRVEALGAVPGARWVPAERWHLTLAFLGEVAEQREPAVAAALSAVTAAPLRLRLAGAGTFPPRGRPSVLWVGLGGDVPALEGLARAVRRAVRGAGVRLERRPYRPHLTVARFRGQAADGAAAVSALADLDGPDFVVDRFALVRSRLGPQPSHEPLRHWPLGDGPGRP